MRTFSVVACCLGALLVAAKARAAGPEVLEVTAALFKQFDKDRSKSLNAAELQRAADQWKKYVRGKIGGDGLKAFEGRVAQLIADGDGSGAVNLEEFREFAAGSLGIPVPPLPGAIPAVQFPPIGGGGGDDKDKKDSDKKDGDKKDDKDDRTRGVQPQPRFMPQNQPTRDRVPDRRDDRDRVPEKRDTRDRTPEKRETPARTPDRGGGNSSRTPPSGGNSRSPVRK